MENRTKKARRGSISSVLLRYDAVSDLFFVRLCSGLRNGGTPRLWVHKSGKLDDALRILAGRLQRSPCVCNLTLQKFAFDSAVLGALRPVTERMRVLRRLRLVDCSLSATGRELLAPSVSKLIRGFATIRSVSIEGQGFQASQLNGSVIRACIAKDVQTLTFPPGMPCTYISEYAILDFCFATQVIGPNSSTRRRLEIWQPRISPKFIENTIELHLACKDDIRFGIKIYSTDLAKQDIESVQQYLRRITDDHYELRVPGKPSCRILCRLAEGSPCMKIVRGRTERPTRYQ